ncbi:MAG TPA: ABC transporter substrate-binding protein [Chloroflexota bacterium]|nr:ABC transporter substrate-binding protein [Chloroflexota bacterium]
MKARLAIGSIVCTLLAACGGAAAPAASTAPGVSSPASAGQSAAAKPAASTGASAAPASAKPAASGVSASAKPAGNAKPVGPALSSQPIAQAKPGTINLALVGGSPSATPIYVGLENKIFEKYNAPVQLIIMTAPAAMAALIGGDVQIAMEGGSLVSADTTAQKLTFIAAVENGFNQFVAYTKPDIKSLADLKGKTLAVGTPASAASIVFELMVKSAGLDPKKDVKWIYAGTPAAEWAALQQGQVDGATLVWPFDIQAKQKGFNLIGDGKQMHLAGASLTVGAQRDWVKSNGPLVQNFLKALTESSYLANTDKAKAEAAISKRLNVTDQAELDAAFERFSGTYAVPPYITKQAVQEAITDDPNPANKQRKPEDYIDNGPLDALVASGFTKQFVKS